VVVVLAVAVVMSLPGRGAHDRRQTRCTSRHDAASHSDRTTSHRTPLWEKVLAMAEQSNDGATATKGRTQLQKRP